MPDDSHGAERIRREPDTFARLAKPLVGWTGSPWAAFTAAGLAAAWFVVGVIADFPRSWELAVTTGVPLVNLGLLILVQHTQNHDNLAMQLKLDEIIRALDTSSNAMIQVDEEAGTDDLEELQDDFRSHLDGVPTGPRDEAGNGARRKG